MTNEAMREKLVAVANLLKDLTMAVVAVAEEFGEVKVVENTSAEKPEQPKAAEPEKKYTMEDVRKALAEKSSAGFTAEVRALLEKHGGAKLSAVDPSEYPAIMEEAKEIGWSYTTVRRVLSNETYMGDKLLQKTYSIDFLSKDRLKNHGQVPQYYVEGDHEAIIPPDTFKRVQDELERRKGCHATGGSIFSGKIYCGECGQIYGSKVWHSNDPYRKVVWRCNGKYDGEKKCGTPTLTEAEIKRAFEKMLVRLKDDEVLENLRGIQIGDTMELEREKGRLERERDSIGMLAQQAISENARVAQDQAKYNERYNELAAEYERLDAEVKRLDQDIEAVRARQRRLEEFVRALETADDEFTEGLWGSLVEKVTVEKDGLVFTLNSGEEVRI